MLRSKLRLLLLSVLLGAVLLNVGSSWGQGNSNANSKGTGQKYVTLDLNNVDIRLFIQYISELSGKNFILDNAVQGKVTVLSPQKISEEDAYRVFESVLEVNGFTTVPAGSAIKIVPSVSARSKSIDTISPTTGSENADKLVTQLVPLKYSSPDEVKKVLAPLVSKSSVITSHPQSGMLIMTETLSNIQRLMKIIETIDVEYSEEDVAVIPLKNGDSTTVAKIISTIYQRTSVTNKGNVQKTGLRIVPYERVNALVVMADSLELDRIQALVATLDTPVERSVGNIHVYYLQHADSTELAKVLNALPENQDKQEEKGKAPSISQNVKVMPDEETNALIITASRDEYTVLEDVIKKLDIPRQMVYLEALILEVDTSKDFDVGVEWLFPRGELDDGTGQVTAGFTGNSETPYGAVTGLTADELSLPDGFTFGVVKQGIEIAGITFPDVSAILRAYRNDTDINIISTPQILTADNKEAEITVGENVPYITSQNTTNSEQDYTNYEYRDVGTTLKITPQINQADTLRLEIETTYERLQANSLELTPTTFNRTATTTVIVNNNDTVVIGGIIGQDSTISEVKIPGFGDIPLLGWLFKTQSTTSVKTNMFIFITPKIVRNPADLAKVTLNKEDEIGKVLPETKKTIYRSTNLGHAPRLAEKGYYKLIDGDYEEASQYFDEALEIDPNNPYALLNKGVIAEVEGDYDLAYDYYQRVIMIDTSDTATEASDPEKTGVPLLQIARENIEKLRQKQREKN